MDREKIRSLLASPDSQHLAYTASQGGKLIVVVDGKPGSTYDGIKDGSPLFSPDSQHVAYARRNKAKILS